MSDKSKIEWTDSTWTPIRARVRPDAKQIAQTKGYTSLLPILDRVPAGKMGPHCERISAGCDFCYSEANNGRCLPANGTGLPFDRRARDLVDIIIDENILEQPLHWKKPRKVFVCSQTDLFGEFVSDELIDRVFAMMALSPLHTFQVLTKRAERMVNYLCTKDCTLRRREVDEKAKAFLQTRSEMVPVWPLRNVWLGVSVENQEAADRRIPLLLQASAPLRFLSIEPMLGPVGLGCIELPGSAEIGCTALRKSVLPAIDWVIVGGESGHGARPCNTEWIRSIVRQCRAAGVPCFVKQLGAHVIQGGARRIKKSRKGGDMDEWEHGLRVRQSPAI